MMQKAHFAGFFLSPSLLLSACNAADSNGATAPVREGPLVQVVEAAPLSNPGAVQASGIVGYRRETDLAFNAPGVVATLEVDAGDMVRRGQRLATLRRTSVGSNADEAALAVAYSVGTSTANLRSSPALTVNVVNGTATFSEPQANNVGVGDEVVYGANTAYIASRTSSTVYTLRTAKGLNPRRERRSVSSGARSTRSPSLRTVRSMRRTSEARISWRRTSSSIGRATPTVK